MRTLLLIPYFIFWSFVVLSQDLSFASTTTKAVVIGISDYHNEKIPDLKHAHKDAQAFASWLVSPSGRSLQKNHIRILLNKQATTGQMVASVGWLLETSQPGDKAIIYYSGHGDVERKNSTPII